MTTDISLLRERYSRLKPIQGVDASTLDSIEHILQLHLPQDFRDIAAFSRGVVLGAVSLLLVSSDLDDDYTVVAATLRLRESVALPSHFLVLALEDESAVLLDCRPSGVVWWADNQVVPELADGEDPAALGAVSHGPYSDFLGELLTGEEHLTQRKRPNA